MKVSMNYSFPQILAEKVADQRRFFFSSAGISALNPRKSAGNLSDTRRKLLFSTMHENEITFLIRGAIFKVYNTLGPGLLESSYEAALGYELVKSGLIIEHQVGLPMIYEDLRLDVGYRLDLLVEKKVIVEIKSVELLQNVHHLQIMTYLRLAKLKVGLLVNFNTDNLPKNIIRKINGCL